jgi:hypothetical protein
LVWQKILTQLWSEKTTKDEIAEGLNLPLDEVQNLLWGLTGPMVRPDKKDSRNALKAVP